MGRTAVLALVLAVGCRGAGASSEEGTGAPGDDTSAGDDTSVDCELGLPCNPIVLDAFPATDSRDTRQAPASDVDRYACAPDADESGGELWYRVDVSGPGVLTASLDDVSGDEVDIDLHLLGTTSSDSCLRRDNVELSWVIDGPVYLVADTWVDGEGTALAGAYTLSVDFLPLAGACAMPPTDLSMYWSECADGIDCSESGGAVVLHTPSLGPVVGEAHLVTVDDDFGGGWPSSSRDGIEAHYALSQAATGYVADRDEDWAPAGEGGSEYGQGSTGSPLPVLDEAWYVNMYWRDRPSRGTRMLVINPANGRAVVTSAGYETGPGANDAIGGAVEEIHDHLGSSHRSELVMGFAADQGLDLGPLSCE